MIDLGEAMLDAVLAASPVEHVGHVSSGRSVGVTWSEAKLDALVGQDRVDLVGNGGDQGHEDGWCCDACCLLDELREANLLVRSMATKR